MARLALVYFPSRPSCKKHRAPHNKKKRKAMGMGQHYTTRGPQVLVLVSFSRVPFWVPILDPHPHQVAHSRSIDIH